ncbi:MAG TPA: hypothetical protein VFB14_12020 [Bryobacteraceae bacterium]|jgi:hypothetical protein|nr:hypothetical protein [Bryobacteraceae bacterium]
MEAHTPKREAIEKFIGHEKAVAKHWIVRTVDEPESPIVTLRATRSDEAAGGREKTLEVHTRQVRLDSNELDESTKTMIRRWLASL